MSHPSGSRTGRCRTSCQLVLPICLILIPLVGVTIFARSSGQALPDLSPYPWLYLRDGEPLASAEDALEVIAVGDVMLGRRVADEPQPFAAVAPWLRAADIAVGNLECVIISDSETRFLREAGFLLHAPPSAVARLRGAGFDVLRPANNHALDLGSAGLAETTSRLQAAGIATVGAGPDAEAALQPVIREVDGVRLAFLASNAVPDGRGGQDGGWTRADWDPERAAAAVDAARDGADAVVVSVHWGYEYETRVDPAQREAARAPLRAGADLVVGHHPHVVQAFEVDDDRCVAYSLGNFVFDQGRGETGRGLALREFFDEEGLRAVQALPVRAGPRPRLMAPEEASSLLARVRPSPRRIGFTCDGQACRPTEHPPETSRGTAGAGPFWGGRIDLTGDGVPEHVRRVRERAIVYQDGVEVWRSPAAWRVVDLTPGDTNDDGRNELLLALWRDDEEGVPGSHPFIVGYRGRIYRTLWGGSAVSDPVLEVELGDVDGGGAQELIVLEAGDDGLERVAVWRWHGWGFSLMWRSEPGRYRDLVLIGGEADRPIISVCDMRS